MALDLSQLEAEVERNRSVDTSARALIVGLIAKIEETKGDPAKVAALVASLKASTDGLVEDITANTPADGGEVLPPA